MHPNIYKKSLWIIAFCAPRLCTQMFTKRILGIIPHQDHASKYLPTESPSTERCPHQMNHLLSQLVSNRRFFLFLRKVQKNHKNTRITQTTKPPWRPKWHVCCCACGWWVCLCLFKIKCSVLRSWGWLFLLFLYSSKIAKSTVLVHFWSKWPL